MQKQSFFRLAGFIPVMLGVFLAITPAHATTYTWTGAANQDWNRAANWRPAGVPTKADTAIVGNGYDVRSSKLVAVAEASFGTRTRVNFSDNVVVSGALTLNGTEWDSSADLIVGGAFTASQTNLDGSGNLTFNGPIVASNSTISNGKTFTAKNTFSATDCNFSGSGLLVISPTATLTLLTNPTGGGTGNIIDRAFSNAGSVVWSSGNLVVNESLTNQKSAIIELQSSGKLSGKAVGSFFNNTGTVKRNRDRGQSTLDIPYTNTGTMQVESGTLEFTQPFAQTAGECSLNGGAIMARGGMKVQGGVLNGTGTITGDVSVEGGDFKPGHSPGSIVINGNYTQGANGTLNMEIGGTTPGTGYDQLVINGTAKLAGTLNLIPYGGFTPVEGSNFELLEYYSVLGAFNSIKADYPAGISFTTTATPLYVVATAHVSVDSTPPTVVVAVPIANAAYSTLTSAKGTAADNVGVTAVTVQLYRYRTAVTPAGYWAGGNTWTASYSAANERPATGTTNWSVILPTLSYGAYSFRPIAKDAAGNITDADAVPFLKINGTSTVGISTAVATAATNTIRLNFTGPLDSVIALAPARYAVNLSPSNQKVSIQSVSYSAVTNSVTLTVAPGTLVKGGGVIVNWSNLFDTSGKWMKGKTGTLIVQ